MKSVISISVFVCSDFDHTMPNVKGEHWPMVCRLFSLSLFSHDDKQGGLGMNTPCMRNLFLDNFFLISWRMVLIRVRKGKWLESMFWMLMLLSCVSLHRFSRLEITGEFPRVPSFHVRTVLNDDSYCSGDLPEFSMMSGHCLWFLSYFAISPHSWSWNRIQIVLSAMVMFYVRSGMFLLVYAFLHCNVMNKRLLLWMWTFFGMWWKHTLFVSDHRWMRASSHQFMPPPMSRCNFVSFFRIGLSDWSAVSPFDGMLPLLFPFPIMSLIVMITISISDLIFEHFCIMMTTTCA